METGPLSDTSPEAQRILAGIYRSMSPARKWGLLASEFRCAWQLHEAGTRRRNPRITPAEIQRAWVAKLVGNAFPGRPAEREVMNGPVENLEVVREVLAVFESLAIPYVLGGSFASSFHGTPRQTRDADISVDPFPGQVEEVVASFGPDYYLDAGAIRQAHQARSCFNIINTTSGFKVDVFIKKDRPFDQSLMQRRIAVPFPDIPDREIDLATAEDTILLKLEWYRLGGETSDRQWSDILGVLRVQGDRLDDAYLDHWAAELKVADLLDRVRAEAKRSFDLIQ